jgi:hypothetical protein
MTGLTTDNEGRVMARRRFRRAAVVGAMLGMGLFALTLFGGSGEGQAQPPPGTCELAVPPQGPEEPLEMNSVVFRELVKTVVMEKEVFNCTSQSGLPQIKDVETFVEVVERRDGREMRVVDERVEVAQCIKNLGNGRVSCAANTVGLGPSQSQPLTGCSQPADGRQPRDPVEMDTAVSGSLVKTIKVEKETFTCGGGPAVAESIGDLYVFTEIIEAPEQTAEREPTLQPVARAFRAIFCLKDEQTATVVACARAATGPPGG